MEPVTERTIESQASRRPRSPAQHLNTDSPTASNNIFRYERGIKVYGTQEEDHHAHPIYVQELQEEIDDPLEDDDLFGRDESSDSQPDDDDEEYKGDQFEQIATSKDLDGEEEKEIGLRITSQSEQREAKDSLVVTRFDSPLKEL